ncbi:MAG TPA: bifunctional histidinol-phosphatase/imidazoleglycerol-phosphate dehydratase, partial [Bacteroidaceae bacterium]|nr:bifunctional histidinol-phosphatase/imidazoleglycerol-phosphate dehydratase [Bacteroidaceae bacterium]
MKKRVLFIDRDGTIAVEPSDEQIDSFEKLEFMPGVFKSLSFLKDHTDFEFVMASNQDGLGTASYPEKDFWPTHNLILNTLKGEGITFADILIDRTFPEENAPTRKPRIGMF